MLLRASLFALLIPFAACSDDNKGTPTDAPAGPKDAAAPSVTTVTCPATPGGTITAVNGTNAYSPTSVTVAVDGVVKFMMPSSHNVVAGPNNTIDTGVAVAFSATTCLKFSKAGTFGFHCGPHGFTGTVVVQ